jgi:hypothetical protein
VEADMAECCKTKHSLDEVLQLKVAFLGCKMLLSAAAKKYSVQLMTNVCIHDCFDAH